MVPPIRYSGYNYNRFDPSLSFLYDPAIQAYRAVEPSDYGSTLITSGLNIDITGAEIIGISGFTAGALAQTQTFSGSVNVLNNILATSGVQSLSPNSQIGVSGFTTIALSQKQTTISPYITSVSNSTISGSNGTFLAANSNRLGLFVQNLGTGVLYFKYGTSASSGNYNAVIKADFPLDGGNGGLLTDESWTGACSISGAFPRYIAWEIT